MDALELWKNASPTNCLWTSEQTVLRVLMALKIEPMASNMSEMQEMFCRFGASVIHVTNHFVLKVF